MGLKEMMELREHSSDLCGSQKAGSFVSSLCMGLAMGNQFSIAWSTRSKDSQVPGMFPKEFPIAPHFIPYTLANVVLL
jgi:hypothetical protein